MKTFEQYQNENPQIYIAFVKYALQAKQKGFDNYSAKSLFEIIRWHTPIKGGDVFKINNNYAGNGFTPPPCWLQEQQCFAPWPGWRTMHPLPLPRLLSKW